MFFKKWSLEMLRDSSFFLHWVSFDERFDESITRYRSIGPVGNNYYYHFQGGDLQRDTVLFIEKLELVKAVHSLLPPCRTVDQPG